MKELQKVMMKKTTEKGVGLFAAHFLTRGEIIHSGRPIRIEKKRTHHSFQINMYAHVQLDKLSRSINHSCNPNAGVKNNMFCGYDFIALRDISRGEEITWDYETTEYISISVPECLCGSLLCRKKLKGFKYHENELKQKYGEYIADYLKPRYNRWERVGRRV